MFLSKNTIKKPLTFKSKIFFDERGYFQELYLKKKINLSLKLTAVAYSKRGVVRGLHFQKNKQQTMLVSVLKGKINDYCVDLRKNSKSFGKIYKNSIYPGKLLYVPKGFAHGYTSLHKENIVLYHLSDYRDKSSEMGILWKDKSLNIKWKFKNPILSKRDKSHSSLKEFIKRFKGL